MNRVFSIVWSVSRQLWVVASEFASGGAVPRLGVLAVGAIAAALNCLLGPASAWAACVPDPPVTGGTTTCTGTDQVTTVGNGPNLNNVTLIVSPSAQISTGPVTAISLDSNSIITIGSGAVVQRLARQLRPLA